MRFPESWLREWVATELDTEALSERLTLLGLEVDSVEPVAPPFSGVVVGRIDAVEPHPEADKLRVCRVDDGTGTAHQVVCGAPNAAVGLHAPFARVGAVLPDGTVIKATKLRGVESAGMLCSATELGAGEAADGLWDLGDDATVGADLRAHAELDASIFEIDLTPNRGDCLSLRGLARELAAATGEPVQARPPEPVMPALDDRFPVTLSSHGLPALRGPCEPRRGPESRVAALAPAPSGTVRRAADPAARRRHQPGDARARAADACLRPGEAHGRHRCPHGAPGRDDRSAG